MKRIRKGWKAAAVSTTAAALIVSGTATFHGAQANQAAAAPSKAKNVIVFVGDGMGLAQRGAIRLATVGEAGKLEMDDMPYQRFVPHELHISGNRFRRGCDGVRERREDV